MKVFGIGLNKTGTTTLATCLQALGFRHSSCDPGLLKQVAMGELESLFAVVEAHDSFEDWPYPLVFEALDQRFPGSRFILTRRSSADRWLASLSAHALRTDPFIGTRCRSLAYGYPYPQLNPQAHLQLYTQHLDRVRAYFRDRPQDLLEVCWEDQDGWASLCGFLGLPVPEATFPHANARWPGQPTTLRQNEALLAWYQRLQDQTGPGPAAAPMGNVSA